MKSLRQTSTVILALLFIIWGPLTALPQDCCCAAKNPSMKRVAAESEAMACHVPADMPETPAQTDGDDVSCHQTAAEVSDVTTTFAGDAGCAMSCAVAQASEMQHSVSIEQQITSFAFLPNWNDQNLLEPRATAYSKLIHDLPPPFKTPLYILHRAFLI